MDIIGTGVGIPKFTVKNKKIESWGLSTDKWIRENLGIRERRVSFAPSSSLGIMAAEQAIESAGIDPLEIGLLIVATSTPDKINPSTACIIQDRIGAYNAVCFDINAVCAGFIYALSVVYELAYKNALIIGVDTFSHITDWEDRDCVFFGDGAGAVVVKPSNKLFHYKLKSDGRGQRAFHTKKGGTFNMNGKEVFKHATTVLPKLIENTLIEADVKIEEINCLLPHQASKNVLKELSKKLGIPMSKVKTNLERYGNTAAASIPILIHENKLEGKVLMAAIGSGWVYGVIVMEW